MSAARRAAHALDPNQGGRSGIEGSIGGQAFVKTSALHAGLGVRSQRLA